jgi:hypothetical protein
MMESSAGWRRYAGLIACLSVVLGGWVRFSGLDAKSIAHVEMYVPGIRLPEGLSEPRERLTFSRALTGTFSSDSHPPGYYLLMLPWTRTMGTSLWAMRLPSAFLGTASIGLVYALGALAGAPVAGALGAALFAFNGYHVAWSQYARMFALVCFLGLAASALLLWITKRQERSGADSRPEGGQRWRSLLAVWPLVVYALLIFLGLATHLFFWTLLACHMAWTFGNAWGRRELPVIGRVQLLITILASPLIVFAVYQSGAVIAPLSGDIWHFLADFVSFAFALPTRRAGSFPAQIPFTGTAAAMVLRFVVGFVGGFLAACGLWRLRRSPLRDPVWPAPRPRRDRWRYVFAAAGLLASLKIVAFIYLLRYVEDPHSTIRMARLLSILPLGLAAVALIADRFWERLPQPGRWKSLLEGEQALISLLALGPFAMLGALSQVKPLLNERGLILSSPYYLLLLAIGLVSLRRTWWVAALLPVLAMTCILSVVSYRRMTADPADYAQLARAVKAEVRPGDLLFLEKAWDTTPMLYYLDAGQFHLVGRSPEEYALASTQNPQARVWVLLPHDAEETAEMKSALTEYRPVETITALHGKAILYRRAQQLAQAGR